MVMADVNVQGYQILDEEINISFNDWARGGNGRNGYVDSVTGAPLYATPSHGSSKHIRKHIQSTDTQTLPDANS
jgi:hypothetical protein